MWYPDRDELLREHVVTRLVSPQQIAPSPTDRPVATVLRPAPDAEGNDTPAAGAPKPAGASPAPATGFPGAGNPAAPASAAGYETPRAKIPAELLKRLAAPPRKAAGVAPPAGAEK
jgi:hypothetical protein